ncbi:MAG: pilus assembly protein PilM [Chthonomonadaceae bacterium]|nr:pilus assembly protein PilM [Chthonomonadaceae bacterium]
MTITSTQRKTPLSRQTSPSSTTGIGIDLGSASVRVAEVEMTGEGGGRVLRKGKAELPVNVWNNLPTNGSSLTLSIREALASAGISEKNVTVGLPRRLVTLRQVRLPHAPPDQLRSMVAFEAQQHILFSVEDVILDYFIIPETAGYGDDMITVMLAAAQRSLVSEVMGCCERAGLSVSRLTVSALALAENIALERDATAVIDIEPGEVDLAMVSEKRLLFTRSSAVETSNLVPDVANQRLADEISRSLTAYANENRQTPLQQIFITGSAEAEIRLLENSLPDLLEMPVRRLRTRILLGDETDAYATAVGVAQQSRKDGIGQINLAPREREEKRAESAKKQKQWGVVLAGALVVGSGLIWLQSSVSKAQKQEQNIRRANREFQDITAALDAKKKSVAKLKGFETELAGGISRKQPLIDVLYAIDDCVPRSPDIWLTQTNFDRGGTITLRGETKNEMAATDFVLALQRSGAFSEVRLGYMGETQTQEASQVTQADPLPTPAPTAVVATATNPVLPGLPAPGITPQPPPGTGANRVSATPPKPGVNGANAALSRPGAPGANVTLPTVPNTVPATKPIAPKPKPLTKKVPHTSFIVTCRINPGAKTLIPVNRERKQNAIKSTSSINKSLTSPLLESDNTKDEGDSAEGSTDATP